MAITSRNSPFGARSRRGLVVRAWFYCAFSVLGIAAGLFLMIGLLEKSTTPEPKSFVGALHMGAQTVNLSLPAGVVVDDILHGRGDSISKGQTLATYDLEFLESKKEDLVQDLLHADFLQRCLLGSLRYQGTSEEGALAKVDDVASVAHAECESYVTENKIAQDRKTAIIARFEKDRGLIKDYLARQLGRSRSGAPSASTQVDLRETLALSLSLNTLALEESQALKEISAELAAIQSRKLEKLQQLRSGIRQQKQLVKLIEDALEDQRFYAPETGTVVRARQFPKGLFLESSTEFVELRPNGQKPYFVQFESDRQQGETFVPGDDAMVEIPGMGRFAMELSGKLESIQPLDSDQFTVTIALDRASVLKLDDPENGFAAMGEGAKVDVKISLQERNILAQLRSQFALTFRFEHGAPLLTALKSASWPNALSRIFSVKDTFQPFDIATETLE